jgi:putative ABC transport system permease protein
VATLWQDLRYAFRTLLRNPGFTVVAVVTLALGIGANTAIFSAVYGILFRPLPYREPSRLVAVWTRNVERPGSQFPASLPDINDWQAQARSMEGLAAYAYNRYKVAGLESDDMVRAAIVTPEFFSVLGVQPAAGRLLGPEDEHEKVAVLSNDLWRRLFHDDVGAVGQAIRLGDDDYTIAGVMPPSFRFPTPEVQLWLSLSQLYVTSANQVVGNWITNRSLRGYRAFARLKKESSLEQGQADMDAIQMQLAEQYPSDDAGLGVTLVPIKQQMIGKVEKPLIVLLASVGFVLLIACVNVANLMLARSTTRRREMAIRRALGAGRGRLAAQVLTESLLLALLGGGLGVLLATWGVDLFLGMSPADIPRLESVRIDTSMLLFSFAITIATGILFGLAPALRTRGVEPYDALREGSRETSNTSGRTARKALVVAEVALAVVLVAGAGLMINSFLRLMNVSPGFKPDHLLTLGIGASLNRYPKPADQVHYVTAVLDRIRVLPGVETAGACTSLPPNITQEGDAFSIDDEPNLNTNPVAWFLPATPGFVEALGLPMLAGRTFGEADDSSRAPVAIINRSIVERYFANREPIGHRINISGVSRTIVGVVQDTKYDGLAAPSGFQVYVPYAQRPFPGMRVVVRTKTSPAALIAPVREAVRSVDPQEQGSRYQTMESIFAGSINEPRFYTLLLGVFGVVALALAAVGIFGVVSYSVSQRTREIGVRLALGASRAGVLRMILSESLGVIVIGLILGVGAALALTRLLRSLLFEVRAADPATYAGVVLLLLAVGLAAAILPARRAASTDPMAALRCE